MAKVFAGGFFLFILWIIYLANTGADNILLFMSRGTPYGDKVGHFALYGILALALNLAFGLRSVSISRFKIHVGSLAVLVFASVEELSQGMIASRTLDVGDFVFDLIGITAASLVTTYIGSKRAYREPTASLS